MLELTYRQLLKDIMDHGDTRSDRTGVGTIGIFGACISGDISEAFPLFGGRKLFFKTVVTELMWYIRGHSDLTFLHEHGCHIWDMWADANGDLGPIYGAQWRRAPVLRRDGNNDTFIFDGHKDQLADVIKALKTDPTSRRILINSWNPTQLDDMRLPPCAFMVQFYVRDGRYLDVRVDSRSADVMLGLPHNIAVYSLLTYILAYECGYTPGRYTHHLGDVHLYQNHVTAANTYLQLTIPEPPTLQIAPERYIDVDHISHDNFVLVGYNPGPNIKMPVAV